MDAAKKETEASDGKHAQSTIKFWGRRDQPPVQPFLSPRNLPAGLIGHLCLPPKQLPFSPILWNPWPTVNNTQNTPSCLPLNHALP